MQDMVLFANPVTYYLCHNIEAMATAFAAIILKEAKKPVVIIIKYLIPFFHNLITFSAR